MLAFWKRICFVAGTVAGLAFASGLAQAQTTVTSNFNVLITINSFCAITSPTNLSFGSNSLLNANVDQTSTFNVQCTNTTPFSIALDNGANFTGSRRMADGAGNFVNYALYQNGGRTTAWGSGGAARAGTGNGTAVIYTVYGRVPPQTTPAPGNYLDTVTISVTY